MIHHGWCHLNPQNFFRCLLLSNFSRNESRKKRSVPKIHWFGVFGDQVRMFRVFTSTNFVLSCLPNLRFWTKRFQTPFVLGEEDQEPWSTWDFTGSFSMEMGQSTSPFKFSLEILKCIRILKIVQCIWAGAQQLQKNPALGFVLVAQEFKHFNEYFWDCFP